jgi:hypothetical protein
MFSTRGNRLGQVIFLVAAFVAAVIVVALNAHPAAFAGRERVTYALAVMIAVIGATADFVGVTYRLAVVTVGIGAAACAHYFLAGCQFASNCDPLFASNRDPSRGEGLGLSA